jgi:membrane protein
MSGKTSGRAGKFLKKIRFLGAFAFDIINQCALDQAGTYAAQTAFFFLMSIFPFMILLLQLMMVLPVSRESLLIAVDAVVPDYLLGPIHTIMQELFTSKVQMVWVTVLAAFWSSSKAMHSLTAGLDHICSAEKHRGWFVIRLWALLYTALITVALLALLAMNVFWKTLRSLLLRYRPPGVPLYLASSGIKFGVLVTAMTLIFALMYKAFPNRKIRFLWQLPGGFFSGLGWYVFSNLLSVYINRFNGFSMYGSLTAPILVMFWLYFSIYILMIGAEINEKLRLQFFEMKKYAKGDDDEISVGE